MTPSHRFRSGAVNTSSVGMLGMKNWPLGVNSPPAHQMCPLHRPTVKSDPRAL